MKNLIRWHGLVAVTTLAAVLFGLWHLYADNVAKQKIEEYATLAIGAKVELDSADISLFPIGLALTRLQITDPDNPMTNAVEIAKLNCSIDLPWLAAGKVVVDKMSIDRLWFDTPRQTSGAVSEDTTVREKEASEKFRLPSFQKIPDVDEILQKEELRSLKLIEAIRSDIDTIKGKWQKQVAGLSDRAKFKDYERRLKKITSIRKSDLMGIFSRADDTITLHKELSHDIERIKSARGDLKQDLELLQKRIKEAEDAPEEDVRRLKEKYTLSPQGLANMSMTLFGEKIGERTEAALILYDRIRPFLEQDKIEAPPPVRTEGVNVRFKEQTPDFLIRTASISSIETKVGTLTGEIQNIASPQHVLSVPLTFNFSGEELKNAQSLKLDGQLDHTDPSQSKDTINFRVKGYKASDMPLYDDPQHPVSLQKGLVDLDLQADLAGENLSARLKASMKDAKLALARKGGENPLVGLLDSSLSHISQLTLTVDITGTRDDYDTKITSELDRILVDGLGQQAKRQAAELTKGLQPAIYEKVGGPMRELKESMTGLDAIDDDLTDRLELASGLL